MPFESKLVRWVVIPAMICGIVVLSSCGREPEEETSVAEPEIVEEAVPLDTLDVPLSNSDLGFTLSGTPPGLVATYNEGPAIEVADRAHPSLRYTFFVERPDLPIRSPATVEDFETFIRGHNLGEIIERGTIDTSLGSAAWAIGSYYEEDQSFEDLRVFVPHPSGTGTLILASVGPEGVTSLDQRLTAIQGLLSFVSS
jgi:hypothetical protein